MTETGLKMEDETQNGFQKYKESDINKETPNETDYTSEVNWSPINKRKETSLEHVDSSSDNSSICEPDIISSMDASSNNKTRTEITESMNEPDIIDTSMDASNDRNRTESMNEPDIIIEQEEDNWDPESLATDDEEEQSPILIQTDIPPQIPPQIVIQYVTLEHLFQLIYESSTQESQIIEILTANQDIRFVLNKSMQTPLIVKLRQSILDRQWMIVNELINIDSNYDDTNEVIHREFELALLSDDSAKASTLLNKLTLNFLLTIIPINIQLNRGNTLLHLSAIFNNATLFLELFLRTDSNPFVINNENNTPFHVACSNFTVTFIEKLLDVMSPEACNVQNIYGETPLHCLLKTDNIDGLTLTYDMLSKFDFTLIDRDNNTILHLACIVDGAEIIVQLLAVNPRTRSCMLVKNKQGDSFLDLLLRKCFEKPRGSYCSCLNILLQEPQSFPWVPQGNDLKTIKSMMLNPQLETEQLLYFLVSHPKITPHLFEKDTNLQSIFETLITMCLHNKSRPSLFHLMKSFLERPQSNYWFMNNKQIPKILLNALLNENLSLFTTFLVQPYCDLAVPLTKTNDTLLHIVCSKKTLNVDSLFPLFSHPLADPNNTNSQGDTPLHVACRHGNFEFIPALAMHKTLNFSATNLKGNTPLMEVLTRLHNHGNVDTLDVLSGVFPEIHLGDNLLHVATRMNYELEFALNILKPKEETIVTKSYNTINNEGHSPLYIALERLQFDKAEVLLSAYNPQGYSLLQHACLWPELFESMFTLLEIPKYRLTLKQTDRKGNTPLHVATMSQNMSKVIAMLINLDPSQGLVRNKSGETPLHIACQYQYTELIDVLLKVCPKAVNIKDDDDYLPLHSAAQIGDAETVKALLKVDPNPVTSLLMKNRDGDTPIHLICKESASLLQYVLDSYKLGRVFTIEDSQGNTPFHLILKLQSNQEIVDALKAIFKQVQQIPMIYNKYGNTVYHECIREPYDDPLNVILENITNKLTCENIAELVGYAVQLEPPSISKIHILLDYHRSKDHSTNSKCTVLSTSHDGYSLLHYAAKVDCVSLAEKLINVFKADPLCVGPHGNTPLHMACIHNSHNIAKYLLSTTECDINVCNQDNLSPLEIVKNSLPMLELFNKFQNLSNCRNQYAIDSYCKVFVTGHSGAGKTTIIEVFKNFVKTRGVNRFFGKLQKISEVAKHTAGIIPTILSEGGIGNLIIYDLAGHFEYHSSHSAVLEHLISSSCPLFVLLINLVVPLEEVKEQLYYWLNLLQNHSSKLTSISPVIVIGSHDNEASKRPQYLEKKAAVFEIFSPQNYPSLKMVNFIQMDCRIKSSTGLGRFQSIAATECTQLRELAPKVSIICHGLYSFLTTIVSDDEVALQLGDLKKNLEEAETEFLPKDYATLVNHLTTLNDKGLIMFLRNSAEVSKSWIIVQQEVLLTKINGHLFAPSHFTTHIVTLDNNTGLVPLSYFNNSFPPYVPIDTLIQFLVHFELCQVFDLTLFPNIDFFEDDGEEIPLEKLLFFPALIQEDLNKDLWPPDNTNASSYYWFNWVLQCTNKTSQFFTMRFLHVLLLRLAFTFALPLYNATTTNTNPSIRRRCSIWKTGIRWLNKGIWTMIRLTNNHQTLNMVMAANKENHTTLGGKISTVTYRTQVMSMILDTKTEFCKELELYEVFRDPLKAYIPFDSNFKLPQLSEAKKWIYSMTDVRREILKNQEPGTPCHITDTSGENDISLTNLLLFDAYQSFSQNVLDDLFKTDNANELVRDEFVPRLVESLKCLRHFISNSPREFGMTIFSLPECQVDKAIVPQHSEYDQCCAIVRLWIEETNESTYTELHKCFDKLSVFAGRKP